MAVKVQFDDPFVKKRLMYEDAIGFAYLASECTVGHIRVCPRKPVKSISELTRADVSHLFYIASYASTTLFEFMHGHGTNIILRDGPNFVYIDVVVRFQDDGLNFMWTPKPADKVELSRISDKLKDELGYISLMGENAGNVIDKPSDNLSSGNNSGNVITSSKSNVDVKDVSSDDYPGYFDEDNYLLRQLDRVP